VAANYDGIATRVLLRAAGLTATEINSEMEALRWARLGVHTVGVTVSRPTGRALWWWALWESGPGAVLDGVTALQAAGLAGWQEPTVHVTVPRGVRAHRLPGVQLHRPRGVHPPIGAPIPRTRPEVAVVRAAQWASSDRQAATVVAMTVQQRITHPDRLMAVWSTVRRSPRRALLDAVIRDVCDGAHSLGELDFAAMCRGRGLPEPSRQAVRRSRAGRVYLDVWWDELGVHVEIDGVQHGSGIAPVLDALRQNEVALGGGTSLRIPVLGLRLRPDDFLDQVETAITLAMSQAS
jgi:hypothetical protein